MSKALILAEKPSVAREIARVLGAKRKDNGFFEGNDLIVTWALGHLVTLADPEQYGEQYKTWSMETLPILPKQMELVVIPQSSKQYHTVVRLMRRQDVGRIVIATDAGREGELVARWIIAKGHINKPMERLWISSQTDKAIRDGFKQLKPAKHYDALYRSAQARAEADWVIGFNVTRALTCQYNAQLSAGRVQTPTLAMIVAREEAIQRFQSKPYYEIHAAGQGLRLRYYNAKGEPRMASRDAAEALAAQLRKQSAKIGSLKKVKKHTPPQLLFDLTTLQREANARFGFSAKQTLSHMQHLYEEHKLLTYPRTDSRHLTKDLLATLPDRLNALSSNGFSEAVRTIRSGNRTIDRRMVDDQKVSDHHAIIPTEERLSTHNLSHDEWRIYDLVVRRFLAAFLGDYQYEQTQVEVRIGDGVLRTNGNITLAEGWKALDSLLEDDDTEQDDATQATLPPLQQGQSLTLTFQIHEGHTQPPKRFTEGTLLAAMENPQAFVQDHRAKEVLKKAGGIGTPATRADIIEKLFKSFYVEKNGQSIVPTGKGRQLIDIVPDDLRSAALTASWEERLEAIAKGAEKDSAFISDMRRFAGTLVKDVQNSTKTYKHDNLTRTPCPVCGKMMLEVKSKKGKMLVCQDRTCGHRENLSLESNARCPNCHKKLSIVGDKDKRLYVCKCGFREKYDRFNDAKKEKRNAGGKRDAANYMKKQQKENNIGAGAFADAWAKALNKDDA